MSPQAFVVGWEDVPHLSEENKADMAATYMPHEREARTKGVPSLGAGAIYPIPTSEITCDPIQLEPWFRRSYGMDVGWNRTAAIWTALDPETDVLYAYAEHYRGDAEPAVHAAAIRAKGSWIPGVIDPASRSRSQADGESLLTMYIELGLNIGIANNAVESGLYEVFTRLSTGRLKIFKTCVNTLQELGRYRRDDKGRVVKLDDHLMDALRYDVMSGVDRALQVPVELLHHMPGVTQRKKPEAAYHPFAEAYGVVKQQTQRGQSGWMPGRNR